MQYLLIPILLLFGCQFTETEPQASKEVIFKTKTTVLQPEGSSISSRFSPPSGYEREQLDENSFGTYLSNLPLHPHGSEVHLFNGDLKYNQNAHAAVINMDVGTRDLQQCADAVMRLRAEYLYEQKNYADLHFNFTNGFKASFDQWRKGKGIRISGNKVSWNSNSKNDAGYQSLRRYLTLVFSYAGTASLEKELKSKAIKDLNIGDIFIRGGHPGHTVIVVDKAVHKNGNFVFMLAQSYMPAQEIHVLKNPMNAGLSPWYSIDEIQTGLQTPEYDFTTDQLKTFD